MTHAVRAVPVHFLITNGDLSLVAFARELDGIAEQIDKDLADRKFKRPFGAAPAGVPPAPPAGSVPRPQRAAAARRSGSQLGGARHRALWLVLDRRLRMGEDSASGVPWGNGLGTGDVGRLEGGAVALTRGRIFTNLYVRSSHIAHWNTRPCFLHSGQPPRVFAILSCQRLPPLRF
jgi:hypothetical protein